MEALSVRPCKNLEDFKGAAAIFHYFGGGPEDEMAERFTRLLPIERMHAILDGDAIVGGGGAFPFTMTVPGGEVPCAGVTVVGVLPTHRRRGALTALMRAQLDDVRERGEPIAALWASEEPIYGRFGYGLASLTTEMQLPRSYAGLRDRGAVADALPRLVTGEEARERLPAVYERVRVETPGMYVRSDDWWEIRQTADNPEWRQGAGAKNWMVLELDGRDAAYAIYRFRPSWDGGVATGTLEVIEAMADSPEATRELWRFLLGIDWQATISAGRQPVDSPLLHILEYPRRMQLRIGDGLWVRLVDVGKALSARSYATEEKLTLEVVDTFCAWNDGRWAIADGAAAPTLGAADVRLDVQALASVYLGGFSFAELARGGRVEELEDGGLRRADALFAAPLKPWCPEIF